MTLLSAMTGTIGILGFGEAAQTFAGDPGWSIPAIGYDIKIADPGQQQAIRSRYGQLGVRACLSNAAATIGTPAILSLVTADKALVAAAETATNLAPRALFLDMNSISPDKKRNAEILIRDAGGRYVDVAIMAPVQPACLDVPLLLSGADADAAVELLTAAGFRNLRIVGKRVGEASAIKMIRSVMIKGIEALTAECLLAASAAGVTDEVLGSLGSDWINRAGYNLERMLMHGERRAAEMEEVCATLTSLGVEPVLTRGTVQRQRELGEIGDVSAVETLDEKLRLIRNDVKASAACP